MEVDNNVSWLGVYVLGKRWGKCKSEELISVDT
jgi:hypothetical protein